MSRESSAPGLTLISLRQWIEKDGVVSVYQRSGSEALAPNRNSVLAKTAIAFSITHSIHGALKGNAEVNPEQLEIIFSIDNFVVGICSDWMINDDTIPDWKHISGLNMISPPLSLRLVTPTYLNNGIYDDGGVGSFGRWLEVQFESLNGTEGTAKTVNHPTQISLRRLLGALLYELFSNERPSSSILTFPQRTAAAGAAADSANLDEPSRKRMAVESLLDMASGSHRENVNSQNQSNKSSFRSLLDLGVPTSISLLVGNLLDLEDEIFNNPNDLFESVIGDFHHLILEPDHFLFDQICERNGKMILHFRKDKIYGRDLECQHITNAFCRASSGPKEALFIGGVSGSGKTRLVDSLVYRVDAIGAFLVRGKIDLFERLPYSTVMSTFNALCQTTKNQIDAQELQRLAAKLVEEFHSDFSLLEQIIPDINILCPQLENTNSEARSHPQMCLKGTAFILRRFIKVISGTGHTIMFILDDVQWADDTSLELILEVLCDEHVSRFFFVGNFRDNEVDPDHPIFDMMSRLESCGVAKSTLHLGGLSKDYLNEMVSDALCTLPRLCQPLSDVVLQSTKGNPLFSMRSLQSLVDNGLLQYIQEEKRWIWDIDNVVSANMTKDILCLLSSKFSRLEEGVRSALTTMSCFGIKVNESVVQCLSLIPQFSTLQHNLDQAVANGFLIKESGQFKFIHDKDQEAAYSFIPENERDSYHFRIGFLLQSVSGDEPPDSVLFAICDQFNLSKNYLYMKHSTPIDLAGLFVKAGSQALAKSDFPRARSYFTVVESVLPHDHWNCSYSQSLKLFVLRARTFHCCGLIKESRSDLQKVLENGQCLGDKLDAYHLMASIQLDSGEVEKAYATCSEVLSLLHEPMPELLDPTVVAMMVRKMTRRLIQMSSNDLMKLKNAGKRHERAQKFYSLLSVILFAFKPNLFPICIHKWIELCLSDGVTPYSSVGFASFATLLCIHSPLVNISAARTIVALAMSFKNRFDLTEQMPMLIVNCSGFVGYYSRTLQDCVDMHKTAFDVGMSLGNVSYAFYNPYLMIRSAFFAGYNLSDLLKKNEHFLGLAKNNNHYNAISLLEMLKNNFLALMGKDGSLDENGLRGLTVTTTIIYNFHEAMHSFWLCHHERCVFFCDKVIDLEEGFGADMINVHLSYFLRCVSVFQIKRGKNVPKKKDMAIQSIAELKQLGENCENFHNKCHLLEAELSSLLKKNDEAKESYVASIEAAQKTKFVHEEGLACELAGFHHLGVGENSEALEYFNRAKQCYTRWGCQVKVDFINQQIIKI